MTLIFLMIISFLVLIVIAMILAAIGYVFYMQRQLVDMDENSRWDALLSLAKTVSAYAKHEGDTIIQTIQARRQEGGMMPTAKNINNQQAGLAEVMSRLMVVREAYPELKASGLFSNMQESVKEYEENVRFSRMVYNDTVTMMNSKVRSWPSSFIASLLHFEEREYLETDEEQKQGNPDLFSNNQ